MWFSNFLIFSILYCTQFVYFAVTYPTDPAESDDQDPENFHNGRPPQWNRNSTRIIDRMEKPKPHDTDTTATTDEPSNIDGRIIGGTDAEMGDLPYQVAVMLKDSGHICGGTVYSENWVVTAAHCCFEDGDAIPASDFQVIAGELNLKKPGEGEQISDVEKLIIHPTYDTGTGFNDVALFKLKKPLEWTETVFPLRLATKADNDNRQQKAIVSGWGYTQVSEKGHQIDDDFFPDTLKMVEVKLIPKHLCEELHKRKAYKWAKHPSFLCAGALEGGKDSCQADSGGPLACFERGSGKKYHCGVVANGVGCARKYTPGFYTDVSVFHDWIVQQAGPQKTQF